MNLFTLLKSKFRNSFIKFQSNLFNKHFFRLLIFFALIIFLYIHHLSRDIYGGDVGDLVTASYVMGVPHPPGYPLFTSIGHLFSKIPIGEPVVFRVGLISVISSVAALFFYYRYAMLISKDMLISFLCTSILAFSYLFWIHAEIPEVFALNNFFVVILLYFAIKFHITKQLIFLYGLAFFAGLSITHHHTIVLIFPSLFILLIVNFKLVFQPRRLLLLVLLVILGLLPYLYVPIAASRNPIINWDNATNLKRFMQLILRKDYGIAPHIINEVPINLKIIVLKDYFTSLISSITSPVIIGNIIGALSLVKRNRTILISLLLAWFLSGPFFIYYATFLMQGLFGLGVIERFYSFSNVVIMFFLPFGILQLKKYANNFFTKKIYSTIVILILYLIPLLLFIINFKRTDISSVTVGNIFAQDILTPLPKESTLIIHGDTPTFNVWYLRFVLGERRDIDLLTPRAQSSDILTKARKAYQKKFPKDKDSSTLKQGIFEELLKEGRVFVTHPTKDLTKNIWVPKGLTYEFIPIDKIPTKEEYTSEVNSIISKLKLPSKKSYEEAEMSLTIYDIRSYYAYSYVEIGNFINMHYKDKVLQEKYFKEALKIDPENPSAHAQLGMNYIQSKGDCRLAQKHIELAISYSFSNLRSARDIYPYLYFMYEKCNYKDLIDPLKKEYTSLFDEDIESRFALFKELMATNSANLNLSPQSIK